MTLEWDAAEYEVLSGPQTGCGSAGARPEVAAKISSAEYPPVIDYVRLNILATRSGSDAFADEGEEEVLQSDKVEERA